MVSDSRGLSLRFPRFIKVRTDKTLEQASSPEFLAKMWESQQSNTTATNDADDGDLLDIDLIEEEESASDS